MMTMYPLHKVVCIDDNYSDNLYHQMLFEDVEGPKEILCFSSAEEALQAFQGGLSGVDLILLDLRMNGMDGFEFLAEFADLPFEKRPRVWVVTSSEELIHKVLENVDEYVQETCIKPLSDDLLHSLLKKYFRRFVKKRTPDSSQMC